MLRVSGTMNLEAAVVLQAPELGRAVGRGAGQHLVDGGEAHRPDPALVAPEHPEQGRARTWGPRGPRGPQGPEFGHPVLGPRRQQLVVGRHRHAVDVLTGGGYWQVTMVTNGEARVVRRVAYETLV